MDIEVGFFKRGVEVSEVYSADDMAKKFVNAFSGILMTADQTILLEYHGQNLKGVIKSVVPLEIPGSPPSTLKTSGVISSETDVTILKSADSLIKIKSSGKKSVSSTNQKQSTDIIIEGTSQCDSCP
jgi:vesicle-fusing ATPase